MSEIETVIVPQQQNTAPIIQEVQASVTPVAEEVQLPDVRVEEVKKEEDPQFSRKFSALSKKEAGLRQKEQQLKSQEQAYQQYQQTLELAKSNPLELLKAHGTTLEDLISYTINSGEPAKPEDVTKAKLESIEAKIREYEEAGQKHQAQLKQQEQEKTLHSIHEEIKSFVASKADSYELIKLNNAETQVWEVIEQVYLESEGKVTLSQEQAAEMLEQQLESEREQELARVEQYRQTKKYKSKHGQTSGRSSKPAESQEVRTEYIVSKTPSPTLTNNSISVGAATTSKEPLLTREESIKRIAAKMNLWKE